MLKRGFYYGLIGLMLEIAWTAFCSMLKGDMSLRAHTSLIMLPIYGMVLFLEPMFCALRGVRLPALIRGLCYAVMIFAFEYLSGRMLMLIGICPWHYYGRFNIDGVIRLDYLPLWVFAGLMYEGVFCRVFRGRAVLSELIWDSRESPEKV